MQSIRYNPTNARSYVAIVASITGGQGGGGDSEYPLRDVFHKLPVPVSSGKTNRYRLNWGGVRAANSALHISLSGVYELIQKQRNMLPDEWPRGIQKMEAIRCLKRYISREVYSLLRNQNRQVNSIPITA